MQSSEYLLRHPTAIECSPQWSTDTPFTHHLLLAAYPDCSHACSFFAEAQRITAEDYVPSLEDIGRVPENFEKGVMETHFKLYGLSIRVLQVYGQQSYRRKWTDLFGGAMSVIFFTSLSDYDEPGISRMSEQVCVSSCVSSTPPEKCVTLGRRRDWANPSPFLRQLPTRHCSRKQQSY